MGEVVSLLPRQKEGSFWRAFQMELGAEMDRMEAERENQGNGFYGYEMGPDGTLPPYGLRDGEFALFGDDIHNCENVALVIFTEGSPGRHVAHVSLVTGLEQSMILKLDKDERVSPLGSYEEITALRNPELATALRGTAETMGVSPIAPLVMVRAIWMAKARGVPSGIGLQSILRDAMQEDQKIYDRWIKTTNDKLAADGVDYRVGKKGE